MGFSDTSFWQSYNMGNVYPSTRSTSPGFRALCEPGCGHCYQLQYPCGMFRYWNYINFGNNWGFSFTMEAIWKIDGLGCINPCHDVYCYATRKCRFDSQSGTRRFADFFHYY